MKIEIKKTNIEMISINSRRKSHIPSCFAYISHSRDCEPHVQRFIIMFPHTMILTIIIICFCILCVKRIGFVCDNASHCIRTVPTNRHQFYNKSLNEYVSVLVGHLFITELLR